MGPGSSTARVGYTHALANINGFMKNLLSLLYSCDLPFQMVLHCFGFVVLLLPLDAGMEAEYE
jgi:hypothetical protein